MKLMKLLIAPRDLYYKKFYASKYHCCVCRTATLYNIRLMFVGKTGGGVSRTKSDVTIKY